MSPPSVTRRGLAGDIGRLLRTARERRGLSQVRLAARAGLSQQRPSLIENGGVDPRLGDVQRLFEGVRWRLRFEAVPLEADAATDPDLAFEVSDDDRDAMLDGYGFLLRKLHDVPYLVGGRLAALAHGLPVRVHRLDLIVTHRDRGRFAAA